MSNSAKLNLELVSILVQKSFSSISIPSANISVERKIAQVTQQIHINLK